jgi:organic radical activating enzyme
MLKNIIEIERPLEISITHACNLSCVGCLHYNDHKHNRFLSLKEIHEWLEPWSEFVQPKEKIHNSLFNILGGEPTLHKDLCKILIFARKCFPKCEMRLTTNGFFIKNHPKLDEVLYNNNIVIKISIHSKNAVYLEKCNDSLKLIKDWEKGGVKVEWAELHTDYWQIPYIIEENKIKPFNDQNPKASWEACQCKSYQIFEKKIWKCPKIAYLKMQKEKYPDVMDDNWNPYLSYEGLSLESTFKEKLNFFKRKEEFICGMCPNKINYVSRESLPSPIKTNKNEKDIDLSTLVRIEDIVKK